MSVLGDEWLPSGHRERVLAESVVAILPIVRAALEWRACRVGQRTNGSGQALRERSTGHSLMAAIESARRPHVQQRHAGETRLEQMGRLAIEALDHARAALHWIGDNNERAIRMERHDAIRREAERLMLHKDAHAGR